MCATWALIAHRCLGVFPFPLLSTPREGMGPLHCADRREQGEHGMTRRWLGAAAFVLVAVLAACNGDDDDAVVESSVPPTTTVPETTELPETTEATTTTSGSTIPTTEASTTTAVDVEAQVAADYLRVQQALEDLNRAPTLENLDERVSAIAVPGSAGHSQILSAVQQSVAAGERIVAGDPDYSDVIVEAVELPEGPAGEDAVVTACVVTNEAVVNAEGDVLDGTGRLIAARIRDTLQRTSNGWLLTAPPERVGIREGLTTCSF
jgi:hypothetical protein